MASNAARHAKRAPQRDDARAQDTGVRPFDAKHIAEAPDALGVFFLSRGHRVIYIGVAGQGSSIRAELERHLRGDEGACTRSATEFQYHCSTKPLALHAFYLGVYGHRTGGLLPECNEARKRKDQEGP